MRYFFITLLILSCVSCKNIKQEQESPAEIQAGDFSISQFNALMNFPAQNGLVRLDLDYTSAIDSGFVIPSVRQSASSNFIFSFNLKNNSNTSKKFFYKIYYQNESYKFNEVDSVSGKEHEFAKTNFYGSWEHTATTFKPVTIPADQAYHTVTDSFRIVGNPRDEDTYYHLGKNNRWKRNPRVGVYSFMIVVTGEESLKNSIPPSA